MSEKKKKFRLLPGKQFRTYEEDGTPRDLEPGDTVELSESAALAFKDAFEPVGKSALPPEEEDESDDEDGEDEDGDDDGDGDDVEEVDDAEVSEDAESPVEKKKKKKKKKSKK